MSFLVVGRNRWGALIKFINNCKYYNIKYYFYNANLYENIKKIPERTLSKAIK